MNKLLISACIMIISFSACVSVAQLQQQEAQKLGNTYTYSHKVYGDNTDDKNTFNDNNVKVVFSFGTKEIDFVLENLTDNPVKIIWDEASLVQYTEGRKVFHKGVKYVDRDGAQVPTIVPSKTTWSDLVIPTEKVFYREGYYGQYIQNPGGWETLELWIGKDRNIPNVETTIMGLKGQKYRLLLPMVVNGVKKNYTFNFEITDIVKTPPPPPISN